MAINLSIILIGCHNVEEDSVCTERAAAGDCETDEEDMLDNCFQTCTRCQHTGRVISTLKQ